MEILQKIIEAPNLKVFECIGGSGFVLMGESDAGDFNFDGVYGPDYYVCANGCAAEMIEERDDQEAAVEAIRSAANERVAWVDKPMFWATEECPTEYVGAIIGTIEVLRARAEFEDSGAEYKEIGERWEDGFRAGDLVEMRKGGVVFRAWIESGFESVDDIKWHEEGVDGWGELAV